MRNPFESPAPLSQAHPALQIEDYLDHLCAPLVRKTTYEQRLSIRDEVRSHILVLAAGHAELGSSPIEAIQAAMNQFGSPEKIGRALVHEYRQPFTLNKPFCWVLLHAAIGGVIASIAWISVDCELQQRGIVGNTAFSFDCFLGMTAGWIPALQLLKRPASPLKATFRTGAFYLLFSTVLMWLTCILNGGKFSARDLNLLLTVVSSVGFRGALSGAAMSLSFGYLKRFAPQTKNSLAS